MWLRARGYKPMQAARIIGRRKQHVLAVLHGKRNSEMLNLLLRQLPQREMPEPETPETYRAARALYLRALHSEGLTIADKVHRDDKFIAACDDMWLEHLKKGGKA